MSLKNLSATAGSNTLAPPFGAPESSTKIKDYNDLWRYLASVVRHLASPATVASAATTDLGASDETFLTVSGTTTITAFGTVSAGIYKFVTFSGALTLTHNATSLILLGGANRTTVAGDCGLYLSLGSGNWKEYFYSPIGGTQPLSARLTTLSGITAQQATDLASLSTFVGTTLNDADGPSFRATIGANDAANITTGNLAAARITTALNATGTAPIYACRAWVNFDGSTGTVAGSGNVSSVTRNSTGDYTITFTTAMPDANISVVGTCQGAAGNSLQLASASASSVNVLTRIGTTSTDSSIVCVSVFR